MKQVLTTNDTLVLSSPRHSLHSQQNPLSKYRLILLLTGFVFLLSSCEKENLFNLFHEHHKKTVPLTAIFQTTLKNIQMADTVLLLPELDSVYATGVGTPIGHANFMALAKYTPPLYNLTGNGVITSENGDQILFAAVEGPGPAVDPPNIVLTYRATITGGTGRFTEATGGWTTIAHARTDTPKGIDSLQGTINY